MNSATSADVCAYDPSLNRWESLAPLKLPRYKPIASIGGKIYVMGGCMESPPMPLMQLKFSFGVLVINWSGWQILC